MVNEVTARDNHQNFIPLYKASQLHSRNNRAVLLAEFIGSPFFFSLFLNAPTAYFGNFPCFPFMQKQYL